MLTDKMKKIILMALLMILPIVFALESTKVYIIDLSYKEGKLIINDKIVKYGYAPDRIIQPPEGYRVEIVSFDNNIIYSFKFKIPLNEYVDVSNNITNQLSGGLIRLSETDFALILPYYDNAKEIIFYDETNDRVTSIDVEEKKRKEIEKKPNIWIWVLEFVILLILVILFVRHKMKEKK